MLTAKHYLCKKHFYFKIFYSDINLVFHKPKKDQCNLCKKCYQSNESEKADIKKMIEQHLQNKTVSRKLKEQEKMRA